MDARLVNGVTGRVGTRSERALSHEHSIHVLVASLVRRSKHGCESCGLWPMSRRLGVVLQVP